MTIATSTLSSIIIPKPTFAIFPTLTHFRTPFQRMSLSTSVSKSDPTKLVSDSDPTKLVSDSDPAKLVSEIKQGKVENDENDVLVQYVVVRRDVVDEWPTGSVITQGCHASVAAIWKYKDDPHTLHYCSPSNLASMHKVTLEVKGETQMVNLSEKLKTGGILHYLWIEQPENFPTCLATKPYPKSVAYPFFKKLKLCK